MTSDGQGNSVGEQTPAVRIEVSDSFQLIKTEVDNPAVTTLAKSFLSADNTAIGYDVNSFIALVATIRKATREPLQSTITLTVRLTVI